MTSRDPSTGITRGQARTGGHAERAAMPRAETSSPLSEMLRQVRVALAPVQIYGVTVSATQDGVVNLDGAVRTDTEYHQAQRLAARTPGVRKVNNRLVVDTLAGSMPVERTVLSPELAAEIELNHFRFATGTEDSLMDFVGTTDTAIATDETEPYFAPTDPPTRRAPRSEGGYTVVGGFAPTSLDVPIDLEQLPRRLERGDDEIAREIRLALKEDAGTADLPVRVTVRNGVVYLRGTVPSLADSDLVEEVAVRVPGVLETEDELEIADL